MKVNIKKDIKKNIYTTSFVVSEMDEVMTELISDFGEITINIGGKVSIDIDGTPTEVLVGGDVFKRLPSEFPISRSFSESTNGVHAKAVAIAWTELIKSRIDAEVLALKARVDDFSGDEEIIY